MVTSAEKQVTYIAIFIIKAFSMSFLCNEAINIYKVCLHWYENFSDKQYLHVMCFKEQVEMANMSTSTQDLQQNLAAFKKQNYTFCKDIGSTWQPQLWRN